MKVFTCDSFSGHWPVGVAAVVVAANAKMASEILNYALDGRGLPSDVTESQMKEVATDRASVDIICDGNY